MKKIPLTQGKFALVDDEDYEDLSKLKWHISGRGYASRQSPRENGRQRVVFMHRVILGLKHGDGVDCDHINGDRLDNRRANLRPCTRAENMRNVKRRSDNRSGFKGVHWRKDKCQWAASIRVNYRPVHLGYFKSAEEAYEVYCLAADILHGQFAKHI